MYYFVDLLGISFFYFSSLVIKCMEEKEKWHILRIEDDDKIQIYIVTTQYVFIYCIYIV